MKTLKKKEEDKSLTNLTNSSDNPNLWKLRAECWENVISLIEESKLLFKNDFFARSFMLSYTALEEVGKYLMVCDFINDIVSFSELKETFRNHNIKMAYAHNQVELKTKVKKGKSEIVDVTMTYDKTKFKEFMEYRNNSMYVNHDDNLQPITPKEIINKELAEKMLNVVIEEVNSISYAEELNGRIGSKALYK